MSKVFIFLIFTGFLKLQNEIVGIKTRVTHRKAFLKGAHSPKGFQYHSNAVSPDAGILTCYKNVNFT